MSLASINPISTKAWKDLNDHFQKIKDLKMQDMFANDASRADTMCINWNEFNIDYSKNRITKETVNHLLDLANEVQLSDAITKLFSGETINETEQRAVRHTILRNFQNLSSEIKELHHKMKEVSEAIINGTWTGYSGKPITDVVNIGIGGSDLGPKMVTEALSYYKNHLNVHFISNVDGDHISESLKNLNRETTLFIIVSKSFTSQETLTNAKTVRKWFLKDAKESDVAKHFVGVSMNREGVLKFGISEENLFPMWNWVGGRFSLWSGAGLSICCSIGFEHYEELLKGGHEMDLHFKDTDHSKNIPVLLALISIWYNNFFKFETEAIIPYTQYLELLTPYLQQAVMESNGKSVDRNGEPVDYETGAIIWGNTGTNAQHAFFQLMHQGTKIVPADFIGFSESLYANEEHHSILMANYVAQMEALLNGTYGQEVENVYRSFEGNKPTNSILIKKLTPRNLGSLLAMYEHKIFVQGVIWNIFSFDQWGVELGKKLANDILRRSRQE